MASMASKRDYYEVLGVTRSATGKEIATAYRNDMTNMAIKAWMAWRLISRTWRTSLRPLATCSPGEFSETCSGGGADDASVGARISAAMSR
jgi:hypothetical protein